MSGLVKTVLGSLLLDSQLTLDEFVILVALVLEGTNNLSLPVFLSVLNFLLRFLVSLQLTVILDGNELLLEVSE